MCNVTQTIALTHAMAGLLAPDGAAAAAPQYADALAGLERSRAAARLNARNAVAEASSGRESHQRGAALEAGKARTGHGASNLVLDSGSILELMAGQNADIQSESAEFTSRAAGEAAKQRLAEEYYGQKKSLLYERYGQARKNGKNSTLLGAPNTWRNALAPTLELL